ncbi:MAG TPA: hypothetical protein DIU37_03375 [Opitutae bacterium]|nr:hypothetical protein [Opitutae bacterium]|tara:strand:- start:2632 stop:4863 length:2232 start_codon:yes stop_codon:yes gene_type:complete
MSSDSSATQQTCASGNEKLARVVFAPLRPDLIFQRQEFKNEIYYVIKDPLALTYFRIKPEEAFLLTLLDGQRSLGEIARLFQEEYPNSAYDLQALSAFCNQLARSGLLVINARSFVKFASQKPTAKGGSLLRAWMKVVSKLFFIKIPLLDPSAWLGDVTRKIHFVWSRPFVLSALCFYAFTLFWVFLHKEAFAHNTINFFSPYNLFLLSLTVIVIKTCHEFGHASTCRYFGGEVHEMGVCFICFMPCGYVNASDAWMMRHQRHKIYVTLAGVFTEFMIASIAAYVWLNTSEGLAKNLAFNAMVVASVNTLFFNMNPLMRFDGYYVIADLLEIPNLRSKAIMYCSYHMQRILLGYKNTFQEKLLEHEPRGRVFIVYALAAYVYMSFVIYSLSQMFARFLEKYALKEFGLILGIAAQVSFLLFPLMRIFYDAFKPGAHIVAIEPLPRRMAKWVTGVVITVGGLFFIPVHFKVETQGILVFAEGESVSSPTPGFLTELYVRTGDYVQEGQVLGRMHNENAWLAFREAVLDLELARLVELYHSSEHVAAAQYRLPELMVRVEEALAAYESASAIVKGLELKASVNGRVLTPDVQHQLGHYFDSKETVLQLGTPGRFKLMIPITEEQITMIEVGNSISGRFVGNGDSFDAILDGITAERTEQEEQFYAVMDVFGGPVHVNVVEGQGPNYTPIFFAEALLDNTFEYGQDGMRAHLTIAGRQTTVALKLWRKFINMWNLRAPASNPFSQT